MGEIFQVVATVFLFVIFVPILYIGGYLGVDVTFLVNKVYTLVHVDDSMEKQVHTSAGLEHGRDERYTEQLTEFVVIQLVSALLEFIKHIHGTDHTEVHIY